MRQYWSAKAAHPDTILLFRMGDFYEIFFNDAKEAAPLLGITLTSRPAKDGRMPMCGVPHHAWQSYVGRLLKAGRKVAICDQTEPPMSGKLVAREVTRVLTPGTVLDEVYLDPSRSNWLVAAWSSGDESALAACDVSTGEMQLCQLPTTGLAAELDRLQAAELLSPPDVERYRFDPERGQHRLRTLLGVHFLASIGAEGAPLAVGAAGVLLEYLEHNRVPLDLRSLRISTRSIDASMQLDSATLRNLEVGALFELCCRCVTPVGARCLRRWLWAPLRDPEAIELRLSAVTELTDAERLELEAALRRLGDLERLASRAASGLATPRELGHLCRALAALPAAKVHAGARSALLLRQLAADLTEQPELVALLGRALVDDPPAQVNAAGAIRPGYDAQLDAIASASASAREWLAGLEAGERERTGIRSLKVGYNRVFGYYLEVSHSQAAGVPEHYIRKQTLTGAERYITPELKEREAVVLNADQDRAAREQEILAELGLSIAAVSGELLGTAAAIGQLDALASLAVTAADCDWVRPLISSGRELVISGGRHPLVERSVGAGNFVANDTHLEPARGNMVVLTGPNMAGKSTYLRQVALIVLLAQCGSFVPARSARIGLVDRIFTRVGAHDDLAGGMSTFMVEMTETANILNHATPASLVVLDEVGRGTSTYDGLSIAQAVVEYLHDNPRLSCRTLFATHYHELTTLAERLPRVRNERVEVAEEGNQVSFLHKVVPGGADRSYGIHVAALAGLPPHLIARARQILAELESDRPLEPAAQQLGLDLQPGEAELRRELAAIELDQLSPLEALRKLYELRGLT